MGFFSSLTEKLCDAFSPSERKTAKALRNIVDMRERVSPRQVDAIESDHLNEDPVVVSIDRSLNGCNGNKTSRQESARRLNEIFTEVKNIESQRRILNVSRFGKGLGGELWKDLKTTLHGNVIHLALLGEAAFVTHHAVQSEWFSQLGGATAPAAALATALITYESIKKISEVVDYYFRGGRSQRKLLEQERQKVVRMKNERKLAARHYKEGSMSSEEYIHYAADLAKNVRIAEETIVNGRPKTDGTTDESQFQQKKTKEILGEKKLIERERGRKMARAIVAAVAAPAVSVLNGLPLGINEWDGVTPAHNVMASLQGIRYHADSIAKVMSPIPGQALTAFAVGATGLIGRAAQEIFSLHNRFKPEAAADRAIKSMEQSIEKIKSLEQNIQTIADVTPRPGKTLNAENLETLYRAPQQSAPRDFSDLAEAVEKEDAKKAAAEARKAARGPSLLDKVLGRTTRPLGEAVRTMPLTDQDFGESPSLFRAETIRKALGMNVLPGTLLTHEGFMDQIEKWIPTASDTEIVERELYFSDQGHQHADLDVDESVRTALDEAARRCAAERLSRIAEKTAIAAFDPNAVRAHLLVLLGMEDEVAIGQKYFEKLFAQGYTNASRIQRAYFNAVLRALDLTMNISDVSRKREKNIIFDSIHAAIESYNQSQSQAA